MERLYIRMLDGQPFEHPIVESNLLEAFPDLDLENLPSWLAPFERHDPSEIEVGGYELLVEQYVVEDGKVRDNWHKRAMTPKQKAAHLADLRTKGVPGMELDEARGQWVRADLKAPGREPDVI